MNLTDKARLKEKEFIQKLKEIGVWMTSSHLHKKQEVVDIDSQWIYFTTDQSKGRPNGIKRKKVRRAIAFLYVVRTVTKKELESKFSSFGSAFMGLLEMIFNDFSKVWQTPTGLMRLTLKGVRHFFSGVDRTKQDLEMLFEEGVQYVLLNYFYLRDQKKLKWKERLKQLGMKGILDPGGHSYWNQVKRFKEGKIEQPPIEIENEALCEFIKQHSDILWGYFSNDSIGDAETTRKNYEYMVSKGLKPTPVWHVQSSIEELDRIVEEDHSIIAIGGSKLLSDKERFKAFQNVFSRHPKQNFHAFGVASENVFNFPWFSADSSSWLMGGKFGKLLTPNGQIQAPTDWDRKQCVRHNIKQLATLEDEQQLDMFSFVVEMQPEPMNKGIAKETKQIALFTEEYAF